MKSAAPRSGPEAPQRLAVLVIIVLFVGKKRKKRKKFELRELAGGKVKVFQAALSQDRQEGKSNEGYWHDEKTMAVEMFVGWLTAAQPHFARVTDGAPRSLRFGSQAGHYRADEQRDTCFSQPAHSGVMALPI